MRMLAYINSALLGDSEAIRLHRLALASNPSIRSGVRQLEKLLIDRNDGKDEEEPIFILSSGWRAGSTLLQRLIMSSSNVLIWGEPYDECGIIQSLAQSTRAIRCGWPPDGYYYDGLTSPEEMTDKWIANLYPLPNDLWRAHRAFFNAMFADPAKQAGASRWGIKEVRLDLEHALYLRWLYPRARFLFLYRNPLAAYQSYIRHGRRWYKVWPGEPVFTPTAFGKHWKVLVSGFLRASDYMDCLVVQYEKLLEQGQLIKEIENYLDVRIDRSVLDKKVGSSEYNGEMPWVSRLEKWLLKRAVSPLAERMGYDW